MHVLVLSDNSASAKFLSRSLKYENIYSESKTFKEVWFDSYSFQEYSAVLAKTTIHTEFTGDFIKKIKAASEKCPIFIIDFNSRINDYFIPIKNRIAIFPKGVSLHIISNALKKMTSKKIDERKPKILTVKDLELNPYTREVTRFGNKLYLRNKEFQLLEYLMNNTDQILTRQKILESVWDRNTNLFTNTVDVHINKLRKKIDYMPSTQLIETVYCIGYMMHSFDKNIN
jgi:two-component system, OmpR family, copper resistance phosphate regulon response regulator CusR